MASRKPRSGKADQPAVNIIVRRDDGLERGHHGGAWKVAYADFVTAMMAFFLLMWLINATTEAQRVGLADYFSQANVLNRAASGEGKPFGGRTPFDHGALTSDLGAVRVTVGHNPVSHQVPHVPQGRQIRPVTVTGTQLANTGITQPGARKPGTGAATERQVVTVQSPTGGGVGVGNLGHRRFAAAESAMKRAIAGDPALRTVSHQISIHQTPQGLSIQIMDAHDRSMFKLGSAEPNKMTRDLIRRITPILAGLGDPIRIAGYTDAAPYHEPGHSNWDLSVDRANATRQLMEQSGLPKPLISGVAGYADRDLLLPARPLASANRRVGILILRPVPETAGPKALPRQANGVKTDGVATP